MISVHHFESEHKKICKFSNWSLLGSNFKPVLVENMSDSSFAVQWFLMYAAPIVSVERRALLCEGKSLIDQIHSAFLVHGEGDAFGADFKPNFFVI